MASYLMIYEFAHLLWRRQVSFFTVLPVLRVSHVFVLFLPRLILSCLIISIYHVSPPSILECMMHEWLVSKKDAIKTKKTQGHKNKKHERQQRETCISYREYYHERDVGMPKNLKDLWWYTSNIKNWQSHKLGYSE